MKILGIRRNGVAKGGGEPEDTTSVSHVQELASQISTLTDRVRFVLPQLDPELRLSLTRSLDYQRQMMAMVDALSRPAKGDADDPARKLVVAEWTEWAEDQLHTLRSVVCDDDPGEVNAPEGIAGGAARPVL